MNEYIYDIMIIIANIPIEMYAINSMLMINHLDVSSCSASSKFSVYMIRVL